MFILNTGNPAPSTPAAPTPAPAPSTPTTPATPAATTPAAPVAPAQPKPAAPAAPSELDKLRNELAETKRKANEEVTRAYHLGVQSAQATPTPQAQPTTPAPQADEDDDPFGIAPVVEKVLSKRDQKTQTQETLGRASRWAIDNMEFYNKTIPAEQIASTAVNQAFSNYANNPRIPFVQYLQQQLTLVGVQKVTPSGVQPPAPAPSVTSSQSDYGGQTGTQMNPVDELAQKQAKLAELKAKVTTGTYSDAMINEIGVLSFDIQRLSKSIK